MSTSAMLSIIEDIDAAGFESIEFGFGPSVRAVQELDEDPTAWLRLGRRQRRGRHFVGSGERVAAGSATEAAGAALAWGFGERTKHHPSKWQLNGRWSTRESRSVG